MSINSSKIGVGSCDHGCSESVLFSQQLLTFPRALGCVGSSVGWAGAGYQWVGCLESLQQCFVWAWGVIMKAMTNGEGEPM